MFLRISAVFVPCAQCEKYSEHLRTQIIPNYEQAEGLISVTIVRRTLVAYWEFAVISTWRSERAMTSFIEDETSMTDASEINHGLIQRSPPQVYDLVAQRLGASRSDHSDD